jgi:hypothetical protein
LNQPAWWTRTAKAKAKAKAKEKAKAVVGLALALRFLHGLGLLHGAVKAGNDFSDAY